MNFHKTSLVGSQFVDANLQGSRFHDVNLRGADFSDVAKDVTAKTGVQPSENKEISTPNLYGAIIMVSRKATWLTPELYALLENSEGTVDGQMHLSVISRPEYDAWAQAHLKKGSLD